jgi:hypothetical protein
VVEELCSFGIRGKFWLYNADTKEYLDVYLNKQDAAHDSEIYTRRGIRTEITEHPLNVVDFQKWINAVAEGFIQDNEGQDEDLFYGSEFEKESEGESDDEEESENDESQSMEQ